MTRDELYRECLSYVRSVWPWAEDFGWHYSDGWVCPVRNGNFAAIQRAIPKDWLPVFRAYAEARP